MFGIFKEKKLVTASTEAQKMKIQEILIQNHIPYSLRAEDLASRNGFDRARFGSMGNHKPMLVYHFYVDKKDMEWALHLIRNNGKK